jgi:DNA polymerase III epsilon subunit-like protein
VESALSELGIEWEGSAHRALDDARMTANVFTAIYEKLDLQQTQHYKDVYSNAKERRMVKSAVRAMTSQKIKPDWNTLIEKHLKDKLPLDDTRKLAELRAYFEAEVTNRALQPQADTSIGDAHAEKTN